MREKKIFSYVATSSYHVISKEVKNHILRQNWIFRRTCCINNPHWQRGGIIIFLRKCYIVISCTLVGSFWDVLFCCSLEYYQVLMRNQEGIKIELQKKLPRTIYVWDITFLTARPPLYVTLCCFLRLLPRPCQVTYLMNDPYA